MCKYRGILSSSENIPIVRLENIVLTGWDQMELRRKAYGKLLEWKKRSCGETAMLIEGARRVGKSYLALQFASKEYESFLYIDFANLKDNVLDVFESDKTDFDTFFMKLGLIYGVKLVKRKSCVVFDEVQMYPPARQLVKYLVADGRYDYIETGSLIGIRQNIENIVIPSEEERMSLCPFDFEEFLDAMGEELLAEYIWECFQNKRAMGEALHRKAMNLFRQYMIVGGMPQAIVKYVESKDLQSVNAVKQRILQLYREDIVKFARGYESRVRAIFDEIPAQLTKHEKKFILSSLGKNARMREYEDSFVWLSESKVVNHCYLSTEPSVGMYLNTERTSMKCYMGDTGLLITQACDTGTVIEEEVLKAIMFDRVGINEGMFMENVVAQMLVASGHRLFFYSKSDKGDFHNNIEIDFLIREGKKICPVEVKSDSYKKHTSLDRMAEKYSSRLGNSYIVYTKDLKKTEGIVCIPVYMAGCL